MPDDIPVNEVVTMVQQGLRNEEITRNLEARGYNLQQISDAINQAQIKQGVQGNIAAEAPPPPVGGEPLPPPAPNQGLQAPLAAPEQVIEQQFSPPQAAQAYAQQYNQLPAQGGLGYEDVQALVEQVVQEKWREMLRDVGDISVFKARMTDDMEAVKQELLRTQRRLEDLQSAVLGKVKQYNESVLTIGSEMKALEKVFGKILEPLSMNVKELSRITEELRK